MNLFLAGSLIDMQTPSNGNRVVRFKMRIGREEKEETEAFSRERERERERDRRARARAHTRVNRDRVSGTTFKARFSSPSPSFSRFYPLTNSFKLMARPANFDPVDARPRACGTAAAGIHTARRKRAFKVAPARERGRKRREG